MRLPSSRSKRLDKNVWCLPNFFRSHSGTFIPNVKANSFATISHASVSPSSFLLGNFAIHKLPFVSTTFDFGLAPPNDEPGAISMFNHFTLSESEDSPSFSKLRHAASNSRKDEKGGADNFLSLFKNSPWREVFNRKAPIRKLSYTPSR